MSVFLWIVFYLFVSCVISVFVNLWLGQRTFWTMVVFWPVLLTVVSIWFMTALFKNAFK